MNTGRIEALWIKRAHGGVMDPASQATFLAGHGLDGNADVGGKRQVTVIALERWREVEDTLGQGLDPSTRRANVLVSGVDLLNARGKVLRLGTAHIAIRGETRPCEQMDAAAPGLRDALAAPWAGGAYGEVLDGGVVQVGDAAGWVEEAE
jgi:MOSC domain-containing protein YiiM